MTADGEKENVNQHRRPSLERLDEIRHRQNRISTATKRRNGESPSRIHGKTQVDDVLPQLIMVLPFCILDMISSFPWNMIGTIIGAMVLAFAVLAFRRIRKQDALERERKEKLKDPFEVHFLIPKAAEHKVDYHPQDSEYHYPDELTLPSNSEADVLVWLKPRLDLTLAALHFGCTGDIQSKPEPLYYFNPWVKEGAIREIHPGKSSDHYKDTTNIYHIPYQNEACPKDENRIIGLKMRTKKRGTYPFSVIWVMPEGRGEKNPLTIRVG
jgi:hypothetical protein